LIFEKERRSGLCAQRGEGGGVEKEEFNNEGSCLLR
jgi:hypothetical protein